MKQEAHFQMPFLLEGEIIDVNKDTDGVINPIKDLSEVDRAVGYTVLITFPNGSRVPFANVGQACMFGGIGDFFQSRLRASNEITGQNKLPTEKTDAINTAATIGDRVLIAFISGDMRKPVIVACMPHPKRIFDIPEPDVNDTQLKWSYKGNELEVDSIGQAIFISRGAPTEKDGQSIPTKQYTRTDVGPETLPDREVLAPLPSPALQANVKRVLKPLLSFNTDITTDPRYNSALTYPDAKYSTEMGFLELGEWYVIDGESQSVFIDRDLKTLTITNSNEVFQLDKEHKKIFLQSSGDYEMTVAVDYVGSILGNKHQTISKNEWYAVKGDEYRTVGSTRITNIVDKDTAKIGTSWNIEVGTAEPVEGGSGKSGGKHLANIKISTGNNFAMDDDNIYLVHKTGALLTMDKDGNITLMSKDGSNLYLNANKSVCTLMSKQGALLSIDDKITCIDKTGRQMIVIKDNNVDITSFLNVNITAMNVNINGGAVNVGDKATFSAVLGENLQAWLDSHTHMCGAGPTSSPLIPTIVYKGAAQDILSTSVKVRKGS